MKVVLSYIINLVALCLFVVLYIPNIIAQIIVNIKRSGVLKRSGKMAFQDAYLIDVAGAKIYKEFWELTFFKKTLINVRDNKTLSYYLKYAKHYKLITTFGLIIYYLIIIVDFTTWFKGGKNSLKEMVLDIIYSASYGGVFIIINSSI